MGWKSYGEEKGEEKVCRLFLKLKFKFCFGVIRF